MAYIASFGAALPGRIVTNEQLSKVVGKSPEWIRNVSGIEQRRWAGDNVSIVDMAVEAGSNCLADAGVGAADLGMVVVSSGTSERQFPGPASAVAARLGLSETPALDIPIASAGSLFAMVLASQLCAGYGPILVVASEKMSPVAQRSLTESGISVLFGDGAGACLIRPDRGKAQIVAHRLGSDGSFASDLALDNNDAPLVMNGRSVILQASRKIPRVIRQVLADRNVPATAVNTFLMHQANQNLIDRVADSLTVDRARFYSNIRRYGNTSSASLLIAASEWDSECGFSSGRKVCLAAFGAGYHWGAMLAEGV